MEVVYKLRANEITTDLVDSIEKLFGRNEIIITISGEAEEASRASHENIIRPGEFSERISSMRPPEQRH